MQPRRLGAGPSAAYIASVQSCEEQAVNRRAFDGLSVEREAQEVLSQVHQGRGDRS